MAPDIIERWKASSYKTPTSYSSEGVVAGHSGQFTLMRLPVDTVKFV